ncbi:MAG TPA: NAD-dependent epimerase/dehydratase family protein [Tepidisphaeraceae bacterium]|nr:NAD-dependent epimerase/dehydratase family protein [Tepidisphaeraceae bacterium]
MRAFARVMVALVVSIPAIAAAAEEPVSLFNGKDLSGWDGEPGVWSVQDGAITGQTSASKPIKHNTFKLPITIVRFFNVYGPQGRPDMMPWQWTQKISRGEEITLYNAGHLKRDWTYIDDIVDGFIRAIDAKLAFEIINLGCSRPVENVEVVQILERALDMKARIINAPCPASEPLITYADITKARKLLGYDPKINVEEGLRRFVEWMKEESLVAGCK